jgi:hypothetical protein
VFHPGDTIRVVRKNDETLDLMHGDKKTARKQVKEEELEKAEAVM